MIEKRTILHYVSEKNIHKVGVLINQLIDQEMISFIEWGDENGYMKYSVGWSNDYMFSDKATIYTTEQLLTKYKEECKQKN